MIKLSRIGGEINTRQSVIFESVNNGGVTVRVSVMVIVEYSTASAGVWLAPVFAGEVAVNCAV